MMDSQEAAPPAAQEQSAPASPDGFRPGVDTIETVTAKLGRPYTQTQNPDGSVMLIYITSRSRIKGTTFVAIVGLFASGAKARASSKVFTFGADGKLRTFSSSETNLNCSGSLAGGDCH